VQFSTMLNLAHLNSIRTAEIEKAIVFFTPGARRLAGTALEGINRWRRAG
jgi:hypothetical protein